MKEQPRPFMLSLVLVVITIALGLAVRLAHLGLPFPVVKYGGSALWAMMVYWIVSTLLPKSCLSIVFAVAGLTATAVEFVKLWHTASLDAFRHTLAGVLLLGRIFSVWDIVAYWLAIGVAVVVDEVMRRRVRADIAR